MSNKVIKDKEDEIWVVKELFERLANGEDPLNILRSFRDGKYPGSSSGWNLSKLHKVARNPIYIGVVQRFNQKAPLQEFIPVINPEVWNKAQETLDDYPLSTRSRISHEKTTLLEELVFCDSTATPFAVSRQGNKFYYSCNNRACTKTCSNRRIQQETLERYVFNYCRSWFMHVDTNSLSKFTEKTLATKKSKLLVEIKKLTAKKDKIFYEKVQKSDELVLEQNEAKKQLITKKLLSINNRQIEVNQQIEDLNCSLSKVEQQEKRKDSILGIITNWDRIFNKLNLEEKKYFYSQIIRTIYIDRSDIEVILNQKELLDLGI